MGVVWNQSRQIATDDNNEPAPGARVFFYLGGTTTLLSVYSDASQSIPHTNPVVADGVTGRWPRVYIPFSDDSFDERVLTANGSQLWYDLNIPRLNPIDAASDTVPDAAQIKTGHVHWEPIQGAKDGYVRCNGRTIGNAASGANERANADTVDLFAYLWNGMGQTQAAVRNAGTIVARGGSAAADYAANRQITMPAMQGSNQTGLDDMGSTATGSFAGLTFAHGGATTPGSLVGANTIALAAGDIPGHTHSFLTTTSSNGGHAHAGSTTDAGGSHTHPTTDTGHTHATERPSSRNFTAGTGSSNNSTVWIGNAPGGDITSTSATGLTVDASGSHTHTFTAASDGAHTHTVSGTSDSTGSGTAHGNVSFSYLGTFYMRL